MKYIGYILAIIFILAFSLGFLAPIGLRWAVPSVLLLLVVCVSMEYGSLDFLFFALIGGAWLDLFLGLPIGSFAIPYIILGTIGYSIFQSLLLVESNWKYYLGFVIAAELFMMGWLWGYTNLLFHFHWSPLAVSGRQLQHHLFALLLSGIVGAIPVYLIVNYLIRKAKQIWRSPLQLS